MATSSSVTDLTQKRKNPMSFTDMMKQYNPHENVSKNVLTLYEKTSILSLRMEQLANGAPSFLDAETLTQLKDIKAIAYAELMAKKLPFLVCRPLPNGKKEYWRLEDLMILG